MSGRGMQKPSKTAIMLSAIMAPGAGQFLQRRWAAGAFFLIAFLICLVCLALEIIAPLLKNVVISMDFAARTSDQPFVKFRVVAILAWLGLSLVVYFAGLIDTAAAYYRQCRQWSEERVRQWAAPLPPEVKP